MPMILFAAKESNETIDVDDNKDTLSDKDIGAYEYDDKEPAGTV